MLARLHWSLYFLFWVVALIALGGLLGCLLFPLFGGIFGAERTTSQLFIRGAKFGSFYFMIWAPGTSLVLCVIRAYRRRQAQKSPAPGGAS